MAGGYTTTVVLLVILTTIQGQGSSCPQDCFCPPNLEISCDHKQLDSVPEYSDLDNSFISYDLSHNNIADISAEAFVALPLLQFLYLRHNVIGSVDVLGFKELYNLKKLYLDYNVLISLHPDVFNSNPALEILSLRGNPLTISSPLPYSDSVVKLDISHCQLEEITSDFLAGLTQLQELKLNQNSLESLPAAFFDILPSLQRVYLHGNPWRCDDVADLFISKRDVIADYKKIRCVTSDGQQHELSISTVTQQVGETSTATSQQVGETSTVTSQQVVDGISSHFYTNSSASHSFVWKVTLICVMQIAISIL